MGNGLTQKHTAKSLLIFALPTIVMMVFMSMYIMIDGIFVANFVSPEALAGLNLVVPFTNILASAAVLVGAAVWSFPANWVEVRTRKPNRSSPQSF